MCTHGPEAFQHARDHGTRQLDVILSEQDTDNTRTRRIYICLTIKNHDRVEGGGWRNGKLRALRSRNFPQRHPSRGPVRKTRAVLQAFTARGETNH